LLDKIEREALGLGVAVLFQHFEPIDDGASRADQIVTDARAQKRSEVERFEGDLAGHGLVSGSVALTWEPAGAPNRGVESARRCDTTNHCQRASIVVCGLCGNLVRNEPHRAVLWCRVAHRLAPIGSKIGSKNRTALGSRQWLPTRGRVLP